MRSCRAVDLRLGTRPVGTGAVGVGGPSDVDAWDTENGRDRGTSPRDIRRSGRTARAIGSR